MLAISSNIIIFSIFYSFLYYIILITYIVTYIITTTMSRIQEVDLTFLISFSYFYFLLDLLSFILFLELGLELE